MLVIENNGSGLNIKKLEVIFKWNLWLEFRYWKYWNIGLVGFLKEEFMFWNMFFYFKENCL